MTCVLCEAINREESFITQTEHAYCMVPICALKPGHVIVLPRRHVESLEDLSLDEAQGVLHLLGQLREVYRDKLEDPVIMMNTGYHSSQAHLHFHMVPSLGKLRTLVGMYENIPPEPQRSIKEMQEMRDMVKKLLSNKL